MSSIEIGKGNIKKSARAFLGGTHGLLCWSEASPHRDPSFLLLKSRLGKGPGSYFV